MTRGAGRGLFDDPRGDAGEEPSAAPGARGAPLTVRQLNQQCDAALGDGVGAVWVAGELSRFLAHGSGHWYFTLKDPDGASISCAMWRGKNARVRFRPADGQAVLALGRPGVYAEQGRMQLIVDVMEESGAGAAAAALERLRARLAAEGLFDGERKKPIPRFPRTIGVVTSLDGAALRDVLKVLRRRFAGVSIMVAPTAVQGPGAPGQIVAALRAIDARALDALLIVRGGGAREDLAAFDDEAVVRAVAACRTPTVSGVGHEIDTTLVDLAADLRAPTPSAAAELVVREREDLLQRTIDLRRELGRATRAVLDDRRRRLLAAEGARGFAALPRRLARVRFASAELPRRMESAVLGRIRALTARLAACSRRLSPEARLGALRGLRARMEKARRTAEAAAAARFADARRRLARLAAALDALSPLAVLARGYALAQRGGPDGPIVRDAAELAPGEPLHLRFGRGAAIAEVRRVLDDAPGEER